MKTVKLTTCNPFEAQVLQGALQDAGIEAILHNVNDPFSPLLGSQVFVLEEDYARAVEIMNTHNAE